jgi:hypothetical protein
MYADEQSGAAIAANVANDAIVRELSIKSETLQSSKVLRKDFELTASVAQMRSLFRVLARPIVRKALCGVAGGATVIGFAASAFGAAHAHGEPAAPSAPPLSFKMDPYRGVTIEPAALDGKRTDEFELALRESCAIWRTQGLRGVWLHISLAHSDLVPVAVKQGFAFHHADSATLTLVRWLPDTPCTIPAGPSHQVGVGAFVVNARDEVLMVKERSGPAAKYGIWKVPTGLLERGEDIVDGCRREVLEETGVRTTPEGAHVLSFRCARVRVRPPARPLSPSDRSHVPRFCARDRARASGTRTPSRRAVSRICL